MDYRQFMLVSTVAASALAGLCAASCSSPDPAQIVFGDPKTGNPPGPGPGDGGSSGTDGGDASTGPSDPIFGTSTFTLGSPGRGAPAKTANAAHGTDASGQDCIVAGCHSGSWAFGGTLYTDAAGTARVPNAEVRVARADGTEFAKTYTDVDGNFWIDFVEPIPQNSRVGVRTATKKMNMAGAISNGQAGCSQGGTCHGGSAGKVYLTP